MAKKPELKITYDDNGRPIAAYCSCGESMPGGNPRATISREIEGWFIKGFEVHVREKHSGAHLIDADNLKRCSVCGYPFPPDVEPSVDRAFADHLLKAHKPVQKSEDVNQAAARIVREATEKP
jgi:hypothetical protein